MVFAVMEALLKCTRQESECSALPTKEGGEEKVYGGSNIELNLDDEVLL